MGHHMGLFLVTQAWSHWQSCLLSGGRQCPNGKTCIGEPCSRVLRLNSGTHVPCDFIVSFYFCDKLPERSNEKKEDSLVWPLVQFMTSWLHCFQTQGKTESHVEGGSLGKPLTSCQPESRVENAAAEVNNAISQEMTNLQWTFCLKRKQVSFYLAGDS